MVMTYRRQSSKVCWIKGKCVFHTCLMCGPQCKLVRTFDCVHTTKIESSFAPGICTMITYVSSINSSNYTAYR